ncbi:MAG: phenylalanine--tRNA ligase beta subunit-related protein [Marinilabiliaceae bacterium]|nr:phenylalanine--tRNA ligase beta subunit-related protein [Marinilabiliaceae bacterium]
MSLIINVESKYKELFPDLQLGYLRAKVKVEPSSDDLKNYMQEICTTLSDQITYESIRTIDAVESMKNVYRKLGKDPNRYRPSAESLLRRIASHKNLYSVNNVVDTLNLISVISGFSICGFDENKIVGEITLGIGLENEPYEGIGRGTLNIENLPVFRDEIGAFGTPTSDSIRTEITDSSENVLMIFPSFSKELLLKETLELGKKLLLVFCELGNK